MWLDELGESELPADMVQVLSVLTSACKQVDLKIAPEKLSMKWRDEVVRLLDDCGEGTAVYHFMPDDVLLSIQRLSKLSREDARFLVSWRLGLKPSYLR